MSYIMASGHRDDSSLRHSFNNLAGKVFGIDFEPWYVGGYWQDSYECYSWLDGGRMLANASVVRQTFLIEGRWQRASQICTVMTDPDYRGQGLSASLLRHLVDVEKDRCDFFFLFGNEEVLDFYPRFGFQRITQHRFWFSADELPRVEGQPCQLDLSDKADLQLVRRLARERVPVSADFGVADDYGLLMFHLGSHLSSSLYYLPHEDAVVVLKDDAGRILVYDIISTKPFQQSRLLAQSVPAGAREVEILFSPDGSLPYLQVGQWESTDGLFILPGEYSLPAQFRFPVTAQA